MDYWRPAPSEDGRRAGRLAGGSGVGWFDSCKIFLSNAYQLVTGSKGLDGAPVADVGKYNGSWTNFLAKVMSGQLEELAGGPLFLLLAKYYKKHGPVYKLMFGPRSFMVVSDPVMVKHVLKTHAYKYDKGVLAEILEPIMGKGLIPADQITWKSRRRAIVPGFHSKWLNRMVRLFSECAQVLVDKLDEEEARASVVDMETLFCSVSLDIIGKAVFNYDFGSVTSESPVIKSVYSTLREAEHRSMSFVPYWKLPFADKLLKDQVEFKANMKLLNAVLNKLIAQAVASAEKADVEELTYGRDYEATEDASLLRFLVDMRGENSTSLQLRDDLMTMLIAGHETSAAVLTWTLFELVRHPAALAKVRDEVDRVLGDGTPTYDDVKNLLHTRLALVEALRLYPEPPILIRRALEEDSLPEGGSGLEGGVRLLKGTDVFISTWSLHRSETLWEAPDEYRPDRWLRPTQNPGVKGWGGYEPSHMSGLYPNEVATDFSFLPFGGGARKCIGDQFAIMETAVIMAMLLQRFDFTLHGTVEEVGMRTGATIHTEGGLRMTVSRRQPDRHSHESTSLHPVLATRLSPGGATAASTVGLGLEVGEKVLRKQSEGGCPVAH
uniref:Cytochrome P450 enzyme n=1 Tax=Nannochloropsis gaditana (strain CCMP526) TaxID=1093141 RepID=I2CNY8_NANGC